MVGDTTGGHTRTIMCLISATAVDLFIMFSDTIARLIKEAEKDGED